MNSEKEKIDVGSGKIILTSSFHGLDAGIPAIVMDGGIITSSGFLINTTGGMTASQATFEGTGVDLINVGNVSGSATSTGSFGRLEIPGDMTIGGRVTAQEFHTEYVTSSILFTSGSTKFGDTPDDIHPVSYTHLTLPTIYSV